MVKRDMFYNSQPHSREAYLQYTTKWHILSFVIHSFIVIDVHENTEAVIHSFDPD